MDLIELNSAANLQDTKCSSLDTPRFVSCENWSHIFEGLGAVNTRWVWDRQNDQMTHAEFETTLWGWRDMSRSDVQDLAESVVEVNGVLDDPNASDALESNELPEWAAVQAQTEDGPAEDEAQPPAMKP